MPHQIYTEFRVGGIVNFQHVLYKQPRMKHRSKTLGKHSMFRRRQNSIKGTKDILQMLNFNILWKQKLDLG